MPASSGPEKIVIVGFGWVGQANALALARLGCAVFYFDVACPSRHYDGQYRELYDKIKPLDSLLEEDGKNTWYVVCIGDRVSEDGEQDILLIKKALTALREARGKVVLRSTILPKYLDKLPFHIYLPEFLHELNAVDECLNPFIFVLGAKTPVAEPDFIKQWEKRAYKVFRGTPEEASYIKYLSNVWNALRVAFVNEFGDSIAVPADKEQYKKIIRVIDFFFENKSYLRYGRTFGGHCLPKDTRAFMAWKNEKGEAPLLAAIYESNERHKNIEKEYVLPQWFSFWDHGSYRGLAGFWRRWWRNLNSWAIVKNTRQTLGPIAKPIIRLFSYRTAPELKAKWENLARQNPYYYANPETRSGQKVDEFELCQTGESDYGKHVADDILLREALKDFNDKAALEIGAGVGRMTEFFGRDFKKVHAVDISPSMLAIARKRLASLKNIELTETRGDALPFLDESFDLVFSYLVFRHLPDAEAIRNYFNEIVRVLKPGGVAKVQLRAGAATYPWQWFHGVAFTPEEAERLVSHLDLKLVKSELENGKSLWLWIKK